MDNCAAENHTPIFISEFLFPILPITYIVITRVIFYCLRKMLKYPCGVQKKKNGTGALLIEL
jgi:hypothetical protein